VKKKYLLLSVICIIISTGSFARHCEGDVKVNINLPYFAGKPYVFYLMQGDRQDTIQSGALDESGKTVLMLPERYKTFAAMSKFMIVREGGTEIVLNREPEFTVSCTEAQPNINNIHYVGTPENSFFFGQYQKQGKILEKEVAVEGMLQLYNSPQDSLYQLLKAEQNRLQEQYAKVQKETAQSPLYAARIREMGDFLRGFGSRLNLTEKEMQKEQRDFVLKKLNFEQLYNSGLWNEVLSRWIGMTTGLGDSTLLADSRTALNRCTDEDLHGKLLGKLILYYNKYGKENLLSQLGVDDSLTPGHPAPKLHVDSLTMKPVNSLVIFYETGCGSCEKELTRLRANYPALQARGIRVISVSADHDEETFLKNADLFSWTDKYCDYKGFDGDNFKSYQVFGTPTIFVIDKDGIITGRYATMAEAMKKL